MTLSKTFRQCAAQMVSLVNRWKSNQAKALLVKSISRKALRAQFRALQVQYGVLQMGDVLEGDGKTRAHLRLHGEKGSIDLTLALDPKSGKAREVTVTRPREATFVP